MKKIEILSQINQVILERRLFSPEDKILIAVSGGQDSMLLLTILYRLRKAWNWELGIIHCDHKWHKFSTNQAKQIYRITFNMRIKYFLSIPIIQVITEEKARNWRYKLMCRICNNHNYTCISTGHTASDRLETLLYNTIRGSGLDGLQSLSWKRILSKNISMNRKNFKKKQFTTYKTIDLYWFHWGKKFTNIDTNVNLIRPILNITRKQISEQTDIYKIPKFSDPTNTILNIDRNRIRHQLIPYIRKYFNPKIDYVLNNLADIVYYDLLYLDNIIDNIYYNTQNQNLKNSIIEEKSISCNRINIQILQSFPIAIQRRFIKKFFSIYTQNILNFRNIEQIRFLIVNNLNSKTKIHYNDSEKRSKKYIFLPCQLRLMIVNNEIIMYKR